MNIYETIRASSFKIYHNVAHDGLYVSTGKDVTFYFRSAANRTSVSVFGHVRVSIAAQRISKMSAILRIMVRVLHFALCKSLDIFAVWRRNGALHKWLISILWKTAEVCNSQIRSMVVPKSLHRNWK